MLTNPDFRLIEETTLDPTGIINLGATATAQRYRILINTLGQILLDPVPDPEQWLRNNPDAIAAVQMGIAQAATGEVQSLGSFAEYADLDIGD